MFMTDITTAQKRSRRYILASNKTIQNIFPRLDVLLEGSESRLI